MPKKVLMCVQCRKDKQGCVPKSRTWPERCDRCIKYNYKCSPSASSTYKHPDIDQAESKGEHQKLRPAKEMIEELDYLIYLENAIANHTLIEKSVVSQLEYLVVVQAKANAENATGKLGIELVAEAERARDSLAMRGRCYEAEAIERMLCRLTETRARSGTLCFTGFRTFLADDLDDSRSDTRDQLFHRRFSMDLQGGRIFTILGYLADHEKPSSLRRGRNPINIPHFENGAKVMELFTTALKIQTRFLEQYHKVDTSAPYIGVYPDLKGSIIARLRGYVLGELGEIQHLITWIDPIGLQAIQCLPIDQAFRYLQKMLLNRGYSADISAAKCQLLMVKMQNVPASATTLQRQVHSELGELHPLIRVAFLARLSERHSQVRRPSGQDRNDLLSDEPPFEDLSPKRDQLQLMHIVQSAGVIWKPGRHPLWPENPVMGILPEVQFNALGVGLVTGAIEFQHFQGILEGHPSQNTHRLVVSRENFIHFLGLQNIKHYLAPTWTIAHLKAWNNTLRREDSAHIFPAGVTQQQVLSDIVDLYVIGIMHGSQNTIDTLETIVAEWNFEAQLNPALLAARQKIISLSMDFAPYSVLKTMLTGRWFQCLNFVNDIAPRLRVRAGYWESMLASLKDTPDLAYLHELHWQGQEALTCITYLIPHGNNPINNLDDYLQLDRLTEQVAEYRDMIMLFNSNIPPEQGLVPHRLLGGFPIVDAGKYDP